MRLDKYISTACIMTRTEAISAIRSGRVTVGGKVANKNDQKVNENSDIVTLDGERVLFREFVYIMMNKPSGVVSATDDPREKTVLSLLPEKYRTKGLFPAGRLDKDTVGLLVLTNDGKNAHRLLSPRHHVEKKYRVVCDGEFRDEDIGICREGVMLDGELTKPAVLVIDDCDRRSATITLTEGKYHEIKRICAYLGKKVTFLERITFGTLELDRTLERGEWRDLTDEELKELLA